MHRLIVLSLFMLAATLVANAFTGEGDKEKYPWGKAYMFRVWLKDKSSTPFSLQEPQKYLSEKAIARRKRQGIEIDSTDLPVSPIYIKKVEQAGAEVASKSKWNNTLLVWVRDRGIIDSIASMDFVTKTRLAWASPDSIDERTGRLRYHEELELRDTARQTYYGVAAEHIAMVNGIKLHRAGFTGKGMTIAVLDGGFMNADRIPCLASINVAGHADFVYPKSKNIFTEMDHGTKVLSIMAVNEPHKYVGSAPHASYWLLRCEDNTTESIAEEDFWAAAAEFADSVGVDIISSSLGFHDFDNKADNYRYVQLNGHSALISATASMLADKGIILINSAGNDGMAAWKKVNVPADADNIITVGAASPNRRNAAFSSIGPTADGRVKPDLMALGSSTSVITGRGTIIKDVGTSFATPIISGMAACLWQALPWKTAKEMISLMRSCGDNYATPDNIYGYGIPDFGKAYDTEKASKGKLTGKALHETIKKH